MIDLTALRAERERLMSSWAYAFGMGHGCSIGTHPQTHAVVQRVEHITAMIQEHNHGTT